MPETVEDSAPGSETRQQPQTKKTNPISFPTPRVCWIGELESRSGTPGAAGNMAIVTTRLLAFQGEDDRLIASRRCAQERLRSLAYQANNLVVPVANGVAPDRTRRLIGASRLVNGPCKVDLRHGLGVRTQVRNCIEAPGEFVGTQFPANIRLAGVQLLAGCEYLSLI